MFISESAIDNHYGEDIVVLYFKDNMKAKMIRYTQNMITL